MLIDVKPNLERFEVIHTFADIYINKIKNNINESLSSCKKRGCEQTI